MTQPQPEQIYRTRFEARQKALAELERRDLRIANLRLAIFLGAAALGAGAALSPAIGYAWLAIPAALFIGLMVMHDRVLKSRARAADAVDFYRRALGRLNGTWMGSGVEGTDFVSEEHAFAADLDLFGHGSLFELLCTARTRSGEEYLADWMLHPAPVATAKQRIAAVRELRPLVDLREDLALLGGALRTTVRPEILTHWGEHPAFLSSKHPRRLVLACAGLLAAASVGTLGAWAMGMLTPTPFLALLVVQWGVYRWLRDPLQQIPAALGLLSDDLQVLAHVLRRLETQPVEEELLSSLRDALHTEGVRASESLNALERKLTMLDAQRNQAFAPIAFILMWSVFWTLAIERWRQRFGSRIGAWLGALGQFEALCAIAGYSFERPDDVEATLVSLQNDDDQAPGANGPFIDAVDIGHPLIDPTVCARNTLRLGAGENMLLVSGSNMSGKSTMLRTIGINTVLAQMGAPVCAKSLSLSPLNVGATLRIHDSLSEGKSRFYAELQRLQALFELSRGEGDGTLIFLLDEIFHGTNSHDRRIGAEALLGALLKNRAIGLVTTHDLALTSMLENIGHGARNVHFADKLSDGKLVFDYTMQPGVVEKSNAIELMRAVGLPV